MGSHWVRTHWMYQCYGLYLPCWWINEPKHVAEFLICNIDYQYMLCHWRNKFTVRCKLFAHLHFRAYVCVRHASMPTFGKVLKLLSLVNKQIWLTAFSSRRIASGRIQPSAVSRLPSYQCLAFQKWELYQNWDLHQNWESYQNWDLYQNLLQCLWLFRQRQRYFRIGLSEGAIILTCWNWLR
jgi:hypothetical protein